MKPVVLQLIDSFHQGGSERQAVQLTRLLHESGRVGVRLACLSPQGILRNQIADLDLGAIPSFPLNNFYDRNALTQMGRLVRWLKSEKIDILQTHDFYTNVFGMLAGRIAGVPARIASMRETTGMRSSAQKRAQRFAYSLAHHVIANSEAVRDQLVIQGIREEKISVIYSGLNLERVAVSKASSRAEMLSQLGLSADAHHVSRRFVTIIANMRHDVKDYPMFLRAARAVHDSVPEAAFLLAGEGELMESFRTLAGALGLENDVFFLGRCESVAELLSITDVCVLSSKAEGFSNSILEYMTAGRPVVATDVGGAPEAVVEGETGYLVPSGDDKRMAERIIALLSDVACAQRMGKQGLRVVQEKFSCRAQLERTLALYDGVLHARRSLNQTVPSDKKSVAEKAS